MTKSHATSHRRVVWAEGIALVPQHFQQQERYWQSMLHARCQPLRPNFWGFNSLRMDADALQLGIVTVTAASGILPDGTPFAVPLSDPLRSLSLPEDFQSGTIYLCLAAGEASRVVGASDSRYTVAEHAVTDVWSNGAPEDTIDLAALNLTLSLDPGPSRVSLPLCRLEKKSVGRAVHIDEKFLAPMLSVQGSARLSSALESIGTACEQRTRALAERLEHGHRAGPEMAELATLNRFRQELRNLSAAESLHPQDLYEALTCLSSELTTYRKSDLVAETLAPYDHGAPAANFSLLLERLTEQLSATLLEQVRELEVTKYAEYRMVVSSFDEPELAAGSEFYLVLESDQDLQGSSNEVARGLKVGPTGVIKDLVTKQLDGVPVRLLDRAPAGIPNRPRALYFSFDQDSALWSKLADDPSLGIRIAQMTPEMNVRLWAIERGNHE